MPHRKRRITLAFVSASLTFCFICGRWLLYFEKAQPANVASSSHIISPAIILYFCYFHLHMKLSVKVPLKIPLILILYF